MELPRNEKPKSVDRIHHYADHAPPEFGSDKKKRIHRLYTYMEIFMDYRKFISKRYFFTENDEVTRFHKCSLFISIVAVGLKFEKKM